VWETSSPPSEDTTPENTSYGVRVGRERWFVKHSPDADGRLHLESAVRFHAAVRHPAIVPLRATLTSRDGFAVDG
jgi:hypothetical protein